MLLSQMTFFCTSKHLIKVKFFTTAFFMCVRKVFYKRLNKKSSFQCSSWDSLQTQC